MHLSSHLYYYYALFTCLGQRALARIQLLQNVAACLLTETRLKDHISPVLDSLHWLLVNFKVDFKLLLFTYQTIHGEAPENTVFGNC